MPKKGHSGAPKEAIDVQQVKPGSRPSGTKKKPVNEIDQIFAGKKRKVQSEGTSDGTNEKKKPVNEIDLIFAGKKRKKSQSVEKSDVANSSESKKARTSDKKGMKTKNKKSLGADEEKFADPAGSSRSRRKTADGLTIYTEEELGMSKSEGGGGTPLCPFDCDCCF